MLKVNASAEFNTIPPRDVFSSEEFFVIICIKLTTLLDSIELWAKCNNFKLANLLHSLAIFIKPICSMLSSKINISNDLFLLIANAKSSNTSSDSKLSSNHSNVKLETAAIAWKTVLVDKTMLARDKFRGVGRGGSKGSGKPPFQTRTFYKWVASCLTSLNTSITHSIDRMQLRIHILTLY